MHRERGGLITDTNIHGVGFNGPPSLYLHCALRGCGRRMGSFIHAPNRSAPTDVRGPQRARMGVE
jgi:deoxycytidylate deaminase